MFTKKQIAVIFLICIMLGGLVNPATVQSVAFEVTQMTRNPIDYLNKAPLSFASHVYHDTTNQQAFAFNGVNEPSSVTGGLGRWSNI